VTLDRGPYCNDDGDWWFPTAQWSWNEAQKEAALFARESDCVSRYVGQSVAHLCERWDWDGGCEDAVHRRHAYHFRDIDPFAAKEAERETE